MPNTPFFSIITVTRNAEAALPVTAASIRAQTFTDYEWIIVDGASSDRTLEIARLYLDPDRDTLFSEPDQGIYDAMNKGLARAKGHFVNFLNAGDAYADKGVLQEVRGFCCDADVIYGDSIVALPHGISRYRRAGPIERSIGHRMPFSHQAMFTDRDLHNAYLFDTTYVISADYAVIAALFMRGAQMRYLEAPLNVNPVDGDSASVKSRRLHIKEDRRIRTQILGQSRFVAQLRYIQTEMHLAAVKMVQAVPPSLLKNLLPLSIRRRIY